VQEYLARFSPQFLRALCPALRLLDLRPGGERARPLAFHLALFANAQALTKGSGGIPRFAIEFDRHAKLAHHLP
jgi:hypothetical protein